MKEQSKYLVRRSPLFLVREVRFSESTAWLDLLRERYPEKKFDDQLFWDRTILGAFTGDQLLGTVSLWGNELQWLAIDQKFRGRGVGRRLVEAAVQQAEMHRLDELHVKLNPANPEFEDLLMTMGFAPQASTEFYKRSLNRHPSEDGQEAECVSQ